MREVTAEVTLVHADLIAIRYRLVGDIRALRVPGRDRLLDPERLWEHTCFEMFVASPDSDAYVEWNFSPTGQCARFEFSSYRRRERASAPVQAGVAVATEAGELRLDARAPLQHGVGAPAHIALAAVIEDAEGGLSYWAMRHPSDRPDFHHRGGFALALNPAASPVFVELGESP